jgi:hypothetical protein
VQSASRTRTTRFYIAGTSVLDELLCSLEGNPGQRADVAEWKPSAVEQVNGGAGAFFGAFLQRLDLSAKLSGLGCSLPGLPGQVDMRIEALGLDRLTSLDLDDSAASAGTWSSRRHWVMAPGTVAHC